MFNRKEIEYNIRALIETWLFDKKLSPNTFSLEFRNGEKSEKEITSIGKDGVIREMVDAEYHAGGSDRAVKLIENMSDAELKQRLTELVKKDVELGLRIICNGDK